MTFLLLVLYIVLIHLRPWEFWPELETLRLAFLVGNLALTAAAVRFVIWGPHGILRFVQTYLFFGFVVIVLASRVLADAWLGGALEAFLTFSPAFTTAVMIFLAVDSLRKLRVFAASLLCSLVVLTGIVVWSYHTGWETEKFVMQQRTGHDETGERLFLERVRAMGTLADPNDFAQALLTALPLLLPAWKPRRTFRNTFLIALPAGFLLYAVWLTRSRGGILALMFMLGMLIRERMTRFRLVLPVAAAACAAAVFLAAGATGGRDISTDDESAAGRMRAWRTGLQMLASHPLTGVGFERFGDYNRGLAAHNSFVNCFAELGVAGYALWIGLLVSMYSTLSLITRLTPSDKEGEDLIRWAHAVQISMNGLLATAFFLSRTYAVPFYMTTGIVIALRVSALRIFPDASTSLGIRTLGIRTCALTAGTIIGIYLFLRVAGF